MQWIRWTPSERLSTPSSNMGGFFLSLSRIENELFHWNLFVYSGSDGLHRNDFSTPHPTWVEFFYVSHEQKMDFSIGIYSCPMDPIHLVGLYTTRRLVFRWKERGYDWILVDSIGQSFKIWNFFLPVSLLTRLMNKFW